MSGERQDDESIPDSEDTYRRIVEDWVQLHAVTGKKYLVSAAFSNEELSVDLSSLARPDETFGRATPEPLGVVAIAAGDARDCRQIIVRDPMPGDLARGIQANPAHALIYGKKSKGIRRRLRDRARWVYPVDRNPLAE